ncbi:MAG: GntR family transcriptional regulator [Bauldia sp.]|uniref:GntR family transcriptional regulator n=1 Tax=Bauldia sp. TaxID=2575872 RepID=UPI001DD5BD08|nr:GntR family transcriptional regulator [Bauldia sp.]MCB1495444.1 GntR family transcriptional regulator [Bauldia sp.]
MAASELKSAPLTRRSLHDELVEGMRDMIIDGKLKPGEKISERVLTEHFGVSRTPLRECLKALAAEGLVQLVPNRGAVVARITEEEIDELFPILGALEALAGELACARLGDADLQRLRTLHGRMLDHFHYGEEGPYRRINRQFHQTLFDIAGNASLSEMYRQLLGRIHLVRFLVDKRETDWQKAVDDHERIMDALDRRDGQRLAVILKQHLTETAADVSRQSLAPTTALAATK